MRTAILEGEWSPNFRKLLESIDYGEDHTHRVAVGPIKALLIRKWWKRVWTLQELALGKNFLLMCGQDTLSWIHCEHAKLAIHYLVILAGSYGRDQIFWLEKAAWWDSLTMRVLVQGKKTNQDLTMLNLLAITERNGRRASDARDRIYGLLGIANDTIAKQVTVDYKKSPKEVYTEVAAALVTRYGLDTLSYCDSALVQHCPSEITVVDQWPSWVPRWHACEPRPFHKGASFSISLPRFSASDNIKCGSQPYSFHSDSSLDCTGAFLDEVKEIQGHPKCSDILRHWFDEVIILISESDHYKSFSEKEQAIYRTLVSDQAFDNKGSLCRAKEIDLEGFASMLDKEFRCFSTSRTYHMNQLLISFCWNHIQSIETYCDKYVLRC